MMYLKKQFKDISCIMILDREKELTTISESR
jgi:hypothetical protein